RVSEVRREVNNEALVTHSADFDLAAAAVADAEPEHRPGAPAARRNYRYRHTAADRSAATDSGEGVPAADHHPAHRTLTGRDSPLLLQRLHADPVPPGPALHPVHQHPA